MRALIKTIMDGCGYEIHRKGVSTKKEKKKGREEGLPPTYRRNLEIFESEGGDKEWQQLMMYCHVMERTVDIPGDIAEFGVASGASFKALVRISNILNKSRYHKISVKSVYGFDSFKGLPRLNERIDLARAGGAEHGEMREGGFDGSKTLDALLNFCSKNANCEIIQGWFSDTVGDFLKKNPSRSFSLIHMDCDLYSSTKEVLDLCLRRLNVGGIILFDEIFHQGYPGETEAFWEIYNSMNKEITLQFHKVPSMPWKWYCVRVS